MLIYNHKKEFIGIDKNYLKMFNISNLTELQALRNDFADFFVKSPGHIYNFEHVHWIDYILCDDSATQKVLIDINNIKYSASLEIKVVYLTDSPDNDSYLINLLNLKTLNKDLKVEEKCNLSKEPSFNPTQINYDSKPIQDIKPNEINEVSVMEETYQDFGLQIIDEKIKEVSADNETLRSFDTYVFDPELTSSELGLPIDLVHEFVEDFTSQAQSFKDDLYNSISNSDIQTIQTLSHKLKGVAANLRIYDALELLTSINSSDDLSKIKHDIDIFYEITTKLSTTKTTSDEKVKLEL